MWVWSRSCSARLREALEERLGRRRNASLVVTDFAAGKTSRFDAYCRRRADAERMARRFGGKIRRLEPQNWAALATPEIAPIKIRSRFLIVSTDDSAEVEKFRAAHSNRELLVIPVEMAFGTGDHPTTATCLRLMCDLDLAGRSVLDLGCGTGILAIAARKLGANPVMAVDFDREAIAVTKRNAIRNHVSGIRVERRDMLRWQPPRRFDLIVANIVADLAAALFPVMRRSLTPMGALIVSGLLENHSHKCLRQGRRAGFRFERVIRRGKWVTALARMG